MQKVCGNWKRLIYTNWLLIRDEVKNKKKPTLNLEPAWESRLYIYHPAFAGNLNYLAKIIFLTDVKLVPSTPVASIL